MICMNGSWNLEALHGSIEGEIRDCIMQIPYPFLVEFRTILLGVVKLMGFTQQPQGTGGLL